MNFHNPVIEVTPERRSTERTFSDHITTARLTYTTVRERILYRK